MRGAAAARAAGDDTADRAQLHAQIVERAPARSIAPGGGRGGGLVRGRRPAGGHLPLHRGAVSSTDAGAAYCVAGPIETMFDLLGHDENDMTASLGSGLAHNAAMLNRFVQRVAPGVSLTEPPAIELQKHDRADGGFTGIELLAPELHVIVEAKVGCSSPRRRRSCSGTRAGSP